MDDAQVIAIMAAIAMAADSVAEQVFSAAPINSGGEFRCIRRSEAVIDARDLLNIARSIPSLEHA